MSRTADMYAAQPYKYQQPAYSSALPVQAMPYQILSKLGSGTFGTVFLVRRVNDGATFVMKRIPLKDMDEVSKSQTKLEADLLKQLHHPHIVAHRDAFLFENDNLCIVMDYYDGGDFAMLLAEEEQNNVRQQQRQPNKKNVSASPRIAAHSIAHRNLFPESQVLNWFVQIALAVHYLHSHRIVHRDLKTHNIFIDSVTRQLAVGDFGIARLIESHTENDQLGSLGGGGSATGTPLYMSPELLQGSPGSYKSDIWSLGCILYEMLCRKHPFQASDITTLIIKIARGEYSPIPSGYSKDLAKLISRMLDRDPRRRPLLDEILGLPFLKNHLYAYLATRIPRESPESSSETILRQQVSILGVHLDQSELNDAHLEVQDNPRSSIPLHPHQSLPSYIQHEPSLQPHHQHNPPADSSPERMNKSQHLESVLLATSTQMVPFFDSPPSPVIRVPPPSGAFRPLKPIEERLSAAAFQQSLAEAVFQPQQPVRQEQQVEQHLLNNAEGVSVREYQRLFQHHLQILSKELKNAPLSDIEAEIQVYRARIGVIKNSLGLEENDGRFLRPSNENVVGPPPYQTPPQEVHQTQGTQLSFLRPPQPDVDSVFERPKLERRRQELFHECCSLMGQSAVEKAYAYFKEVQDPALRNPVYTKRLFFATGHHNSANSRSPTECIPLLEEIIRLDLRLGD